MENDFKNLAKQLNQNFNELLTTVDKVIAQIPEEKRNETMATNQTIADIKKAVNEKDMDKLNEILKKCQSQL